MRKRHLLIVLIFATIVSLISGLLGIVVGIYIISSQKSTNNNDQIINNSIGVVNGSIFVEDSPIIKVANKAKEAVVSVVITKDVPVFMDNFFDSFWFGFGRKQIGTEERQVGAGTGFIISKDGMIVTNRHVVQDEKASYTVILNDGTKYEATVLARDTLLDIAFLKINLDKNIDPLPLGSSEKLQVGQAVIAIGNALGEFSNTVSFGIISGLKRNIVASDGFGTSEILNNVIQTDASINKGNSGGPLLDLQGNVIGVNVAVASGAENIGFAIPIDLVKDLIDRLKKDGSIERPRLGVRYQLITKELAKQEGLPFDYGAIIVKGNTRTQLAVIPGSPADKAGIQENDIILEVNGIKINEQNPLINVIQSFRLGDVITIKLWQKGETKEIKVKLEKF
ncbi:MAG: trypsin-like peptidase domain-containing protein [Candidatus Dojkabacteria bacterium]|nr:trypsin-like peptidase domain-containing protein [Candidatus Dojkabacteria bacterium]